MKRISLVLLLLLVMVQAALGAAQLTITSMDDLSADFSEGLVSANFSVTNTGNETAANVSFSGNAVHGASVLNVSYVPATFNLNASDTQTVTYQVTVSDQQALAYALNVSSGAVPLNGTTAATITINPTVNVTSSVALSALTIAKGFSKEVKLTLENDGNTPVNVTYRWNDTDNLGVDTAVKTVALGHLEQKDVMVAIAAPSSAATGSYTLKLEVQDGVSTRLFTVTVEVVEPSTELLVTGTTDVQVVDLAERNDYTFVVKNNGTAPMQVTVKLTNNLDVYFPTLLISPESFTLAAGASKTVTVSLFNDDDEDFPEDVDYDTVYKGVFEIKGGSDVMTYTLSLESKSELEITKIEARVNGRRETGTIDVTPGDDLEIIVRIKNTYTDDDDEDVDMDSVEGTLFIDGIDDGDELEIDADRGSIRADDDGDLTFSFTVPFLADRDSYTVHIEVEAEDERGNVHFVEDDSAVIFVDKDKHRLIFDDIELDRTVLTCSDRTLHYSGYLYNIGRSDEDDVELMARISGTDYETSSRFSVDENDYYPIGDFLTVEELKNGNYVFVLKASFDRDDSSVTQTLAFKVDCEGNAQDGGTVVIVPDTTTPDTTAPGPSTDFDVIATTPQKEGGFSVNKEIAYVVFLVAMIMLVLVGIVVLVTLLVKKA